MGREVKRVPLDFDAPLDAPWAGYENPHFRPCPAAARNECHAGYSNAGKWLVAICRFMALIGEQAAQAPYADRLRARGTTYPHPYLEEFAQAPRTEMPASEHARLCEIKDDDRRLREAQRYLRQNPPQLLPLDAEILSLIVGLAGGKKPEPPFGSDLGWEIQKTLLKAAGLDPEGKFGHCRVCGGDAVDPAVREAYEAWDRQEPPVGDGWQLWQTVSDGPLSPVFATADELVDWMSQPDTRPRQRWNADDGPYPVHPWGQGWRRETAERFVKGAGWMPSGVSVDGRMLSTDEVVGGQRG